MAPVKNRTPDDRARAEAYSQMLQGSPIATFIIDMHHLVTHWNKACETLTGIPARRVVGTRNHWKVFYASQRPVLADLIVDQATEKQISSYYKGRCKKSEVIDAAFKGEDYFPDMKDGGKWLYFTAAPLSDENGNLIGSIETIQDITKRKQMEITIRAREKELERKTAHLEEVNQALKALLDHREVEIKAVEASIRIKLKKFIYPYLQRIEKCRITNEGKTYIDIIMSNLSQLVAPPQKTLSSEYLELTPAEVRVADLIRQGKSTKQIADFLNLSPGSVSWHRNNIRRKLGLSSKSTNLRTYLSTLSG